MLEHLLSLFKWYLWERVQNFFYNAASTCYIKFHLNVLVSFEDDEICRL